MNECTWARRSACVAVWLGSVGLYGCGTSDTGQDAAAPDDFRHAYVLSSASADVSRDIQETHAGNDLKGSEAYVPSSAVSSSTSPHGWTPQQFQAAYNVPLTQQDSKPSGYGIKVAIITAYHYGNMQSDLNAWASHFSQRPITLNIINQAGNITNSSWALQGNIAVQMVSTVSPGATIYVIEAKSVSQTDIRTAIQTAVSLGVNIVSMPFGADETFTEGSQAYLFSSARVVWIAASGDATTPSFPATYADVIAVGGTTLSSVNPFIETAWVDAGAGMSIVERMPSYQMISAVQQRNTTAYRSVPDVAFSADPQFGAQIYASVVGGWFVVGGT